MKLPITEFLSQYDGDKDIVRLHMPGHKGKFADCDNDITEVHGADSLYEADGIIAESEALTSELFGTRRTYYSTEGSSQVIKAMCYLAVKHASKMTGKYSRNEYAIAASRNVHKSFINASILMEFDIAWLPSEDEEFNLCKCNVTPAGLRKFLTEFHEKSTKTLAAVLLTSPDYLGNMLDVKGLAEVAHEFGTLLIVDNAHGSYLKFVGGDMHPISLGADMTSDSAHKTLPALTGGAYMQIAKTAPEGIEDPARQALLLFGSTSPSYKIMRSIELSLERIHPEDYVACAEHIAVLKDKINAMGVKSYCDEPFKITLDMRGTEIDGNLLSEKLRERKIFVEYTEADFIVTMWSPFNEYPAEYDKFERVLAELLADPKKSGIVNENKSQLKELKAKFELPEVVYQPYETMLMTKTIVPVDDSLIGEIAADNMTGCPPAISPIIAGEKFDKNIVDILKFYGVKEIGIVAIGD